VNKSLLPGGNQFVGPLSPSELAQSWQGSGAYPGVDTYTNVTLSKGQYVLGSAPGQSPYYTTFDMFANMDGTAQDFYRKLQIGPNLTNPAYPPYRNGVTIYEVVTDSTKAASGITLANPQFGPGGALQLFIPDYDRALTPVYSIPFKKP
jgi:filamentous hemagglutinin